MTNQEIQELIEIFRASGLAEMEVQRSTGRLRMSRGASAQEMPVTAPIVPTPVTAPAPVAAASAPAPVAAAPEATHSVVKSPIVGTYYDCPSPGAPPFVKVGDAVAVGQPLCIIESMKLMNEIEAEIAGTLVQKMCENGRPVEYGQPLFAIQPN